MEAGIRKTQDKVWCEILKIMVKIIFKNIFYLKIYENNFFLFFYTITIYLKKLKKILIKKLKLLFITNQHRNEVSCGMMRYIQP